MKSQIAVAGCLESAWGGQLRIETEMEGMQDIKEMLRMVLEQQEKLTKQQEKFTKQQEKLIVKVEGMEAIQNAQAEMMKGLENRMEQQLGETMKVMGDVSGQLRFMNW